MASGLAQSSSHYHFLPARHVKKYFDVKGKARGEMKGLWYGCIFQYLSQCGSALVIGAVEPAASGWYQEHAHFKTKYDPYILGS